MLSKDKPITYNDETHTLLEWCQLLHVNFGTMTARIRRNGEAAAFKTAFDKLHLDSADHQPDWAGDISPATAWRPTHAVYKGRIVTMRVYAKKTGITCALLNHRVNELGWGFEEAISAGPATT